MKFWPVILGLVFFLTACWGGSESTNENKSTDVKNQATYRTNVLGMAELQLSDQYTRSMGKVFGFYVGPETVVANLSELQGAYRVRVSALGATQYYKVEGYTAYDVDLNLVLLKVSRNNENFLTPCLFEEEIDTLYTLLRSSTKLLISRSRVSSLLNSDSLSYYILAGRLETGKPAFSSTHDMAGIIQKYQDSKGLSALRVLEGKWISQLLASQHEPKPIIELSGKNNRVYPSYKKIKGFRMITNKGDITFKLYNETPDYRDNFIKLVADQFYDSLTIHRVIRGFLIQTGAADTKDASSQDIVGWRGPGYTLPMKIVPGIFHKRGAIAASKLPDAKNPKDESDGSQFYIVSGRVFLDQELDDLEKKKGIHYTKQQRQIYGSVGGAPHLDGDYTVFGEVISGMKLVDEISLLETYQVDRPVEDVRIKRIEFIYR